MTLMKSLTPLLDFLLTILALYSIVDDPVQAAEQFGPG